MPGAALTGRRVLVTRSAEDAADWARELTQRGAAAVLLPCIRCETIDTPQLRAGLAAAARNADWLVFTSRRGVTAFTGLRAEAGQARVAAVGEATAAAAREHLGRVDLLGRDGTAAGLAAALLADGGLDRRPRVVLVLAANAGDTLERELTAAGATCTRFDVYRTVPSPPLVPKRSLASLGVDNVVLASPSAVTGFMQQVAVDASVDVYTIGPSTTAAARRHGLTITAEAREPSLNGILEAMQWQS